jgi:hypothetical protein
MSLNWRPRGTPHAFAFQVYGSVPWDADQMKLLEYLSSEFDFYPHASFGVDAE